MTATSMSIAYRVFAYRGSSKWPGRNASAEIGHRPRRRTNGRSTDRAGLPESPCRNIQDLLVESRPSISLSRPTSVASGLTWIDRKAGARASRDGFLVQRAWNRQDDCPSSREETVAIRIEARAPWTPIRRPDAKSPFGSSETPVWSPAVKIISAYVHNPIKASDIVRVDGESLFEQSPCRVAASLPMDPALPFARRALESQSSASRLATGVRLTRAASAWMS